MRSLVCARSRGCRIALIALVVLQVVLVALGTVATPSAGAAAGRRTPVITPRTASLKFYSACTPPAGRGARRGDDAVCVAAALPEIDRARAAEGLAPISLPSHYTALSPARQLFVLADLDRVDRGLRPAAATSPRLDRLARRGALGDLDPLFPEPFRGVGGGSNWIGSASPLLAEFTWLYDDGLGSGNLDCLHLGADGCWGHRRIILAGYGAPLLMGAATTTADPFGRSAAEEFVSGDPHLAGAVRWAPIASRIPVGMSATVVRALPGSRRPLLLWASGARRDVGLAVTSGASAWSVDRTRCRLAAGTGCTVHLYYDPRAGTSVPGRLTVATRTGTRQVALRPADR